MQIRVIGNKSEIDDFCTAISGIFPDFIKSKLYAARDKEGSFLCYITVCSPMKGEMTYDKAGQSNVQNHKRNNSGGKKNR